MRAVIASASTSRTRSTAQTTSTRPSAASRASSRQRSSPTTVGPRAAKLQANVKLGEQAKQLAALQNRASMEAKGRRPMGTRQSSRLRGSGADEDEWQQIPEDWLGDELGETAGTSKWRDGGMNRRSTRSRAMTSNAKGEAAIEVKASIGLDSDDESDLTELSDEDEEAISNSDQGSEDELSEELEVKVDPEDTDSEEAPPSLPDGFVEWETVRLTVQCKQAYDSSVLLTNLQICVTLQEWDNIADRFKDSNHYLEKALFKALVNVVPVVTAQLKVCAQCCVYIV